MTTTPTAPDGLLFCPMKPQRKGKVADLRLPRQARSVVGGRTTPRRECPTLPGLHAHAVPFGLNTSCDISPKAPPTPTSVLQEPQGGRECRSGWRPASDF